jgi:uncharacterized membrane protein YhaH (DUF805 family)
MTNRIGRLEFLFWCAVPIVVGSVVCTIVALSIGAIDFRSEDSSLGSLVTPVALVAAVVIFRAEVSRFHDLGWSGWWFLLIFVPLVGIIVFLLLILFPGHKTRNLYGEPPKFLQILRRRNSPTPD